MAEESRIPEIYTVDYRPFDGEGEKSALLSRVREEFFRKGRSRGTAKGMEDGQPYRVRYRLARGRFEWKKKAGRSVLQETFSAPGEGFRLLTRSLTGELRSSAVYDGGLRWVRTAYFAGDPSAPEAVLQKGKDGILLTVRKPGGTLRSTRLFSCPADPGSAEEAYLNARAGESDVLVRTSAGTFCFCPEEECSLRKELLSSLQKKPGTLIPRWPEGGDQSDSLNFHVIPNAPVKSEAFSSRASRAENGDRKVLEKAPVKVDKNLLNRKGSAVISTPGDYAMDPEISIGFPEPADKAPSGKKYVVAAKGLPERERKEGRKGESLDRKTGDSANEDPSGKDGKENGFPSGTVPESPGKTKEKDFTEPERKSQNSEIRKNRNGGLDPSGGEKTCCESQVSSPSVGNEKGQNFSGEPCPQDRPALIPAKRIVVSSMESYLYFGKLINGLREGQGRTQALSGHTAYEGRYRYDLRDGFGVYYYKSGRLCYAGGWKRNLRDGMGVAFGSRDGSIFVGHWKGGVATGRGSAFDMNGNLTYTGEWKNGCREGHGTEYQGGRVLRTGIWRLDRFVSGYEYLGDAPEETLKTGISGNSVEESSAFDPPVE